MNLPVSYKKLSATAIPPTYKTQGAAGADLYADCFHENQFGQTKQIYEEFVLLPGNSIVAQTNIALEIEDGYQGTIKSRSGLAFNFMTMAFEGTIDSDYRGSVNVLLYNLGSKPIPLMKGDRIAQIVFTKVERANFTEVQALSDTNRGTGGFGSTGK